MKVRLTQSMYRNHSLIRKDTIMEIPDDPKVPMLDPNTGKPMLNARGEPRLRPISFSPRAMVELPQEDRTPVTKRQPGRTRKRSTVAAEEEVVDKAVTEDEL